jgi:hypothetical protein
MKISDTTTRTLTIVLQGAEIDDIHTICHDYLLEYCNADMAATGLAQNIMKSLEVD